MKFGKYLIATSILLATIPSFSNAASYTIKLQSYYSSGMLYAEKKFAKSVAEKTGGEVKIIPYSASELVPSGEMLNAVKTGTIGMSRGMGHFYTEQPLGVIETGLPMAWTSSQEAEDIYMKKGLKEIIAEEYAKHGVKYLTPIMAAPYQLLGKRPIKSIDDMKKMKIRAVGAAAKMLTNLGVKTVSMPPEDVYLALTTGQIDGVLYGSPYEFKTTKYYEGARFINMTPITNPIVDNLIINQNLWDSLPKEYQQAIQSSANEFRTSYYKWITSQDAETVNTVFKNTQTTFSDLDKRAMTKASLAIWDAESVKSKSAKRAVQIIKNSAEESGRL